MDTIKADLSNRNNNGIEDAGEEENLIGNNRSHDEGHLSSSPVALGSIPLHAGPKGSPTMHS